MIARNLTELVLAKAADYPVVTVTGPRQSGKTTLCRAAFPDKPYVSLEALHVRRAAQEDPQAFLRRYRDGAIFDEVQHVPDLVSYLQLEVDEDRRHGRFILTGSQHLDLSRTVSQSLAGRTGVLHLLPLSYDEVLRFPAPPTDVWATIVQGGYPRIYDEGIAAGTWLEDYVRTYLERDVRELLNVGNLHAFQTFMRLCAGRSGQELNLSDLGADAGISFPTAKAWLSVLEASFIVFRLASWHRNDRKRWVKAPKLHFLDSGLLCYLLGIQSAGQLETHPLRGAIFESWVAAEVYKWRTQRGRHPYLYHLRAVRGEEVDLVVDASPRLILAEAKSGSAVVPQALRGLESLVASHGTDPQHQHLLPRLIYGGSETYRWNAVDVLAWRDIHRFDWD
ncbi:MAG: ATP-binding protein [Gammaproteobacteria bacterium]